eukprot:2157013-Pyramimonas_sp.AAC.1
MENERLSPKARKRGIYSAGRYQEVRLVHPDGASARTLVNELLIAGWRTTANTSGWTKQSGNTNRQATVCQQTTVNT